MGYRGTGISNGIRGRCSERRVILDSTVDETGAQHMLMISRHCPHTIQEILKCRWSGNRRGVLALLWRPRGEKCHLGLGLTGRVSPSSPSCLLARKIRWSGR